ncbi:MAG: hypothetical protein AB1765_08280 [Candidatus Hydrogenedentota bacterium]
MLLFDIIRVTAFFRGGEPMVWKKEGTILDTNLKELELDVLLKLTIECIREIQDRKTKIEQFIDTLDEDMKALLNRSVEARGQNRLFSTMASEETNQ